MPMKLPVLRKGYKDQAGDDPYCEAWENYLAGLGFEVGEVDGEFTDHTHEATCRWQKRHCLGIDGVVGRKSWGQAIADGLLLVGIEDSVDTSFDLSEHWPPPPANLCAPYGAAREKLFGRIECKPAPVKNNPEAIQITNGWQKGNLTTVEIPQLKDVEGAPKNCTIFCHRLIKKQLAGLFKAWGDQGLIKYILTWQGSWVPRYVRGSRKTLSNHAYGTAFDINYSWNKLGKVPAVASEKGSVRRLVQTANVYGFYWGGHYTKRPDGMHFEAAKIII